MDVQVSFSLRLADLEPHFSLPLSGMITRGFVGLFRRHAVVDARRGFCWERSLVKRPQIWDSKGAYPSFSTSRNSHHSLTSVSEQKCTSSWIWAAGITALAGGLMGLKISESDRRVCSCEQISKDVPAKVMTSKFRLYSGVQGSDIQSALLEEVVMLSGSASLALTEEIAYFMGVTTSEIKASTFADGECAIQINTNCRDKDVFVVQSFSRVSKDRTLNDAIIEMLLTISAARRASAKRITAVIPYFAYARQSRKGMSGARTTIAAADIAAMLEAAGVDRILTVDIHSPEIVGCFSSTVSLTNIVPTPIAAAYYGEKNLIAPVVVSPKSGGIYRAKRFRLALSKFTPDTELVTFVKENYSDGSTSRRLLGDVKDRDCILVDDMIDTGKTIVKAAQRLKRAGARRVFVYVSHGLFSGTAYTSINKCADIDEVVVSNTIELPSGKDWGGRSGTDKNIKIRQLSLAPVLAEAITRMFNEQSTRALTKH